MQPLLRKWLPMFLVAGFIIGLDQISKAWIVANLDINETMLPIPALQPYFQFTRITNTGFAFGIGEGGSSIILAISVIIVVILFYAYLHSAANARLQQISLAIVVGGAVGNIIDRIQYGHVVDFFHVVIPDLVSNVSNFADHAVVIGVIILLIDGYLEERREKREEAEMESSADQVLSEG